MNAWGDALDLDRLDEDPSNIAVVLADGTIAWTNRAWDRFAVGNGGRLDRCGVGARYFDAILGAPHAAFVEMLDWCRREQRVAEIDYECSSERVQRLFRLRAVALGDRAFLLVHHLRIESEHPGVPVAPTEEHVSRGLVVMCSGCRRTAVADYARWDWIPSWITNPPARVTHGLCPVCVEMMFYEDRAASR